MFQISEENKSSGILQSHNGSSKLFQVSEKCSYYNPIAEESLHRNIENTSTRIASTQTSAEFRNWLNSHNQPTDFNIHLFSKIGRPSSAKSIYSIPKPPPSRIEEPINGVNAPYQNDVTTVIRIMKQQLQVLEKGEARAQDNLNEDDVIDEWKKVGLVFDRFFLIIFSMLMLAMSLFISIKLYSQS